MGIVRKLGTIVVLVVSLGSCASLTGTETPEPDVVIAPGRGHEECLEVDASQIMDYSFSASAPVAFNVHYHVSEVVYPVKGEAVRAWQGVFDPTSIPNYEIEKPPFFCLKWNNTGDKPVKLYFDIALRDRE